MSGEESGRPADLFPAADLRPIIDAVNKLAQQFAEITLAASNMPQMPEPSRTPPMWAVTPQNSKRDRRSTRRVK